MKHVNTLIRGLALAAAAGSLALAHGAAQAGVSVSVGVHEPGFYGRVVVGEHPPAVVYQQPVVIQPSPVAVVQQPIYLRVPPGQYQRWSRYCGRYGACGQPVYFVRDMPRPVVIREPMRRPGWDRHDHHGHHHHDDHRGGHWR